MPKEKLTAGTELTGSVGQFLRTPMYGNAAPRRLLLVATLGVIIAAARVR
jgi:hypothetical protein